VESAALEVASSVQAAEESPAERSGVVSAVPDAEAVLAAEAVSQAG
jgi:hypothetical protein